MERKLIDETNSENKAYSMMNRLELFLISIVVAAIFSQLIVVSQHVSNLSYGLNTVKTEVRKAQLIRN